VLGAFAFACSSEDSTASPSQSAPECYSTAECTAGSECTGGSCELVTSCVDDAGCALGEVCAEGVCRATCTDDAACASTGRVCDVALGHCVAANNPIQGTGGAASTGGAAGTGAAVGTGGDVAGTGGNPDAPMDTLDLIDDFTDGDIVILPNDGRIGSWYTYNEDAARPAAPNPVDGAMHATGSHTGAAQTPYGGIGVDLNNANADAKGPSSSSRQTYDVSQFDGFKFRIKAGSQSKSIRFEVVTYAIATTAERGGCSGDGCFDAHGKDVPLTSDWVEVKVPFSSLVQEGWGQQKAFDATKVLGVAFEDLTSSSWDFWIDDFALYEDDPVVVGDPSVDDPAPVCGDTWGGSTNGSITWYTFSQGTAAIGDINCSYGILQNPDRVNHVATGAGQYFGAMNTADYDTAAACGACVRVKRVDNNKTVDITIVDQCPIGSNPKCVSGHIDLSKAAFLQLGTEAEGYIGQRAGKGQITWEYIPCPTTENVSFRLKENNPNWNMVIVEGHRYPIVSVQVQVDGKWLNASRAEYNFWLPPGGKMGTKIRATDVNGDVVEGTVSDTGQQFECQ
jgi:expansin (peptidoglycan-binding protein)